jgi:hypothetical protein
MDIPLAYLVHQCTVLPYLGTDGNGAELFGPEVSVQNCLVDTGTKYRVAGNAQQGTGDETTRPVGVYTQLAIDTASFVPSSRLRYNLGAGDVEVRILQVERLDGGALPVPSHVLIRGQ